MQPKIETSGFEPTACPGIRQYLAGLGRFYLDGFRSMRTGKTLWKIILLKIAIFLLILKIFFPDYLQTHFSTDQQRANHVLTNLTDAANSFTSGGR